MKEKKQNMEVNIRSSAAEYLTFIAATGDNPDSIEMRYENENVWLTQKMMAELYDISISAINQHLKTIFSDNELNEDSVIKNYLITAKDDRILMATEHELLTNAGKVSMEVARQHAITEWEKCRIVQDRLFESDFDRFLQLNNAVKKLGNKIK